MMGFGVAVASAGPYANNVHLSEELLFLLVLSYSMGK